MDEEQINEWYEEQKEILLERYIKELEDKKDKDKAEQKFKQGMHKIMRKYNDLMRKYLGKQKIKRKIKEKVDKVIKKIGIKKKENHKNTLKVS